jgi:hypothetical protein
MRGDTEAKEACQAGIKGVQHEKQFWKLTETAGTEAGLTS